MPFALVAALFASLGIHALALFGPDLDLTPPPEPLPLQAEIVLQPRALPQAKPATPPAKRPAPPKPKAPPREVPASETPAGQSPESALPAAAGSDGNATAAHSVPPVPPAPEPPPPAPPAQLALPPTGEIEFTVTRGEPPTLIGRSVQSWTLTGDSYRIVNVTETVGLAALLRPIRIETESRGRIVGGGLAPDAYTSHRQVKGIDERVDFDWAAGVVRFSNGGSSPLPAGAQDLLSFNFQLGWLSKTGPMSIATTRKIGRYELELVGEELLQTPVRLMRTLHFRAPGETTTEVWLAPGYHLLPVKIRHIDKKGEIYDEVVAEIRIPE